MCPASGRPGLAQETRPRLGYRCIRSGARTPGAPAIAREEVKTRSAIVGGSIATKGKGFRMTGYVKIHQNILTSSIWSEDDATRIVWFTLLALADKHGEVNAAIPGLASQAHVSVDACEAAIKKFLGPDKYSRTPHCEGRRIEAIDGGGRS